MHAVKTNTTSYNIARPRPLSIVFSVYVRQDNSSLVIVTKSCDDL